MTEAEEKFELIERIKEGEKMIDLKEARRAWEELKQKAKESEEAVNEYWERLDSRDGDKSAARFAQEWEEKTGDLPTSERFCVPAVERKRDFADEHFEELLNRGEELERGGK